MKSPVILREGSGVVAILKPVGLATQAPPGIESVEQWLRDRLGRDASGYLGVPHRLDRAVSGVVLMWTDPARERPLQAGMGSASASSGPKITRKNSVSA
jgi:23S rRNA-/tRNA-specific pseudouridylate synthase